MKNTQASRGNVSIKSQKFVGYEKTGEGTGILTTKNSTLNKQTGAETSTTYRFYLTDQENNKIATRVEKLAPHLVADETVILARATQANDAEGNPVLNCFYADDVQAFSAIMRLPGDKSSDKAWQQSDGDIIMGEVVGVDTTRYNPETGKRDLKMVSSNGNIGCTITVNVRTGYDKDKKKAVYSYEKVSIYNAPGAKSDFDKERASKAIEWLTPKENEDGSVTRKIIIIQANERKEFTRKDGTKDHSYNLGGSFEIIGSRTFKKKSTEEVLQEAIAPQQTPQVAPQVAPQVVAPQPAQTVAPQAAPQVAPQVAPQQADTGDFSDFMEINPEELGDIPFFNA